MAAKPAALARVRNHSQMAKSSSAGRPPSLKARPAANLDTIVVRTIGTAREASDSPKTLTPVKPLSILVALRWTAVRAIAAELHPARSDPLSAMHPTARFYLMTTGRTKAGDTKRSKLEGVAGLVKEPLGMTNRSEVEPRSPFLRETAGVCPV